MPEAPSRPVSRAVRLGGRYAVALAAILLCWAAQSSARSSISSTTARTWARHADQAHLREWLDQSRNFRKTLRTSSRV